MRGFWIVLMCVSLALAAADTTRVAKPAVPDARKITGEIKTVFGIDGRPVNQSQTSKGFHRVTGTTRLVNGRATIRLNTRTVEGRQDVTFLSKNTFKGIITVLDTTNGKSYRVVPLSAKEAYIISTDSTDTQTVNYTLEGE